MAAYGPQGSWLVGSRVDVWTYRDRRKEGPMPNRRRSCFGNIDIVVLLAFSGGFAAKREQVNLKTVVKT